MARMKPLAVTYERCHELLKICEPSDFEKESGLKNKVTRRCNAKAGDWAGCIRKEVKKSGVFTKYWVVQIDNRLYSASRIIYFMYHGVDPHPLEVDHEDRNSLNNNVDNLRLSGRRLQGQNRGLFSNNKSGVKGVSFCKRTGKWRADIRVNNKLIFLGRFATAKKAAAARNAAVKKHWSEEAWEANLVDLKTITN